MACGSWLSGGCRWKSGAERANSCNLSFIKMACSYFASFLMMNRPHRAWARFSVSLPALLAPVCVPYVRASERRPSPRVYIKPFLSFHPDSRFSDDSSAICEGSMPPCVGTQLLVRASSDFMHMGVCATRPVCSTHLRSTSIMVR